MGNALDVILATIPTVECLRWCRDPDVLLRNRLGTYAAITTVTDC